MNTNQPPDNSEPKQSVEPTSAINELDGCPPIEAFREPDFPVMPLRSNSRTPTKGASKSGGKSGGGKTLRVSSMGNSGSLRKKKPKKVMKKSMLKRSFQK